MFFLVACFSNEKLASLTFIIIHEKVSDLLYIKHMSHSTRALYFQISMILHSSFKTLLKVIAIPYSTTTSWEYTICLHLYLRSFRTLLKIEASRLVNCYLVFTSKLFYFWTSFAIRDVIFIFIFILWERWW